MYTVGGGDAKLFLKRRLFRTPQKIPTDPVEYHLIYSQAVHSVLHGDFPLNDQAALRLAGLKAQVDWGDFDQAQTGRLYVVVVVGRVKGWVRAQGRAQGRGQGRGLGRGRCRWWSTKVAGGEPSG